MQKLSLIRTDRKEQQHLSTQPINKFIKYVQAHPKSEAIGQFRHLLRYYAANEPQRRLDVIQPLPRVLPSVELMRDGDGSLVMKQFNGLLLLTVSNLQRKEDVEAVKAAARLLPMTTAAITGASGRSVKLLVSVARADGSMPATEAEAEHLCQRAYPLATGIYEAALGRQLTKEVISVRASFRLTLDDSPYYNANAVPLRVDELAAPLAAVQPVADNPAPVADGQKVIDGTRQLITFIDDNYHLRHNQVMGYTEYLSKKRLAVGWQPVDDLVLNGIAMEARLAGLNVWDKDIRRYVRSNMVKNYNPIEEYLWTVDGRWDGKDHIGRLAGTVPTDNRQWPLWFRRWLLAMVAQWLGRNRGYGNAIVPLLISQQGYNKSTFCRRLIPDELQWGYTDNLQIQDKKQVLQQMSQMLLINLDEFNQISPAVQQGFLKNTIQLPSVKVKRPYGRHVEDFPRRASFIATTNMADVLADPSGSRRFIGIELNGPIDVRVRPNHEQLYAQAMQLLRDRERYWFDEAETAQIIASNQRFQKQSDAAMLFNEYFEPAGSEKEGEYLTATAIFTQLRQQYGSLLKTTSLTTFGRTLAGIPGLTSKHTKTGTKYLVKVRG